MGFSELSVEFLECVVRFLCIEYWNTHVLVHSLTFAISIQPLNQYTGLIPSNCSLLHLVTLILCIIIFVENAKNCLQSSCYSPL